MPALPPQPPTAEILWASDLAIPAASELSPIPHVEYSVIKAWEPEKDGFPWLHGVAIIFHQGTFYASWGHNRGKENTPTEINQEARSQDHGRTWSKTRLVASHTEDEGRSHGVFFSHQGTLWQFLGRFGNAPDGRMYDRLKMEAYQLNEATDTWESRGIAAHKFWPYQEPTRLPDGNWIMGGMIVPTGAWARPAVAISRGENFLEWEAVEIPTPREWADGPIFHTIWGETSVILLPDRVLAIIRGGQASGPYALVSESFDNGCSWSQARNSNLPMTTSKPYTGTLSTGQHYLIGNTVRDHEYQRAQLTIAVTRPSGSEFCRMWRIRDLHRKGSQALGSSYPYAIEHEGKLYVAYSSSRGPHNQNEAELAVLPISDLQVP